MPTFTLRCGSKILYRGHSLHAAVALFRPSDDSDALRFFSVCSGIEAASVAWTPLGWNCVGVAEIEKFPSAVLKHHYPHVPNHGDFTKIRTAALGRVDILCGGTPCQAFSIAGARRSLDDARGNLTLAFVGLAHELADGNGLRNVVWENVPGVLSTKDNAFGCFLAGLVGADEPFVPVEPRPVVGRSTRAWGWSAKEQSHYVKWPRSGLVTGPKGRAAWTVKDAQYFGLAQRRERVIVVADFGNGADPAAVLFEPEGVRRHSPPSREAGQNVAPTISARPTGGGGLGTDFDLDGGLLPVAFDILGTPATEVARGTDVHVPLRARTPGQHENSTVTMVVQHAPEIARCVATREGSSQDFESTTMVAVSVTGQISHALKAEGADASEDGTGRGTPIIAFQARQADVLIYGDKSGPLDTGFPGPTICFSAKDYGADATVELSPTLRAGGHSGSHANAGVMPAVAFQVSQSGVRVGDVHATLDSNNGPRRHNGALCGSAVRRLTPRECERLQGFQFLVEPTYPRAWQDEAGRWWSPDYTAIPWRGKDVAACPDGPRYKALGNSWAVPKFRWLGERIARLMPIESPSIAPPLPY